ncbi:MAG TPA: GNAT family N-acetyltransferase [Candidatus Paceibacterota bacterium]
MKNGGVIVSHWTGDLAEIVTFYKKCGYGAIDSVNPNDLILVAKMRGHGIVGVVRITEEGGVKVFRGMQVLPRFRGQGIIGPALRLECGCRIARECYLITYPSLTSFYEKILFRVIPDSEAPKFMRERVRGYRQKHRGKKCFIIMRREANYI